MSKSKELLAYPLIDNLSYRQKIDSEQLNRMLGSLEESVLRCILKSRDVSNLLKKLSLAMTTSYLALDKKPSISLQPSSSLRKTVFATPYGEVFKNNLTIPNSTEVNHDKVFGDLSLGWSKIYSKVPLFSSIDGGVPDTVSPLVTMYVDGILRKETDDSYDCLDQRNESFWIENISAGEHTIEFNFPASINKYINYVKIIPLPLYGVEVKEVTYTDLRGIDNKINIKSGYGVFPRTEPIKLYLSSKEFGNTIKIKVNALSDLNVVGFSNIDFGFIDYQDTPQTVFMKFHQKIPTSPIDIKKLTVDYYIDSDISKTGSNDLPVFDVRLVTDTTTTPSFSIPIDDIFPDSGPSNGNSSNINSLGSLTSANGDLYVRLSIKEFNKTTPVIKGIRLEYE